MARGWFQPTERIADDYDNPWPFYTGLAFAVLLTITLIDVL